MFNIMHHGARVYLAAVLAYLAADILGLAGNAVRDDNKSILISRYIQLDILNDEELNTLCVGVTSRWCIAYNLSRYLPKKNH